MEKVLEWIKKHKAKTVLLGIIIFLAPLIIIHLLFKWYWGADFFVAEWSAGELLGYVGTFFAFAGTVALGILALWQNDKLSKQNDAYRKMIENKDMPKLVTRIILMGGGLMSFEKIKIINLTESIATDFEILKCGIRTSRDEEYFKDYEIKHISKNYLSGKDEIVIDIQEKGTNFTEKYEELVFEIMFQYKDIYGRIHNNTAIKDLKSKDDYFTPMKTIDYFSELTDGNQ